MGNEVKTTHSPTTCTYNQLAGSLYKYMVVVGNEDDYRLGMRGYYDRGYFFPSSMVSNPPSFTAREIDEISPSFQTEKYEVHVRGTVVHWYIPSLSSLCTPENVGYSIIVATLTTPRNRGFFNYYNRRINEYKFGCTGTFAIQLAMVTSSYGIFTESIQIDLLNDRWE